MTDLLSIVLPTGGRAAFLARWLRYAAETGFPWPLIIVDDGGSESIEESRALTERYSRTLKLELITHEQHVDLVEKIGSALDSVRTPYAVLGADDDFFSAEGLTAAVDWLRTHDSYSIAHGSSVVFHLKDALVHAELENIVPYRQSTLEQNTASERLISHLDDYATTWYSVERTHNLRRHWQSAAKLRVDLRFGEFLPSCLSVIEGKTKCLPGFYMARQGHALRVSVDDAGKEFEWVSGPKWSEQYVSVRDCLAEALAAADRVDLEVARKTVQQAIHTLLVRRLSRQLTKTKSRGAREFLKRVPGLPEFAQIIRSWSSRRRTARTAGRAGGFESNQFSPMLRCIRNRD